MEIKNFAILSLLALVIAACSEQVPQSRNDTQLQSKSGASLLNGTWMSPCEQGTLEYVQSHVTFDNGTYRHEIQFHPYADCIIKTKPPTVLLGTYEVGNDVLVASGIIAKEIDITVSHRDDIMTHFEIYYLQNDVLFMGVKNSPTVRPTEVDLNYPYTRQTNSFVTLSTDGDSGHTMKQIPQRVVSASTVESDISYREKS